MIQALCRFLFAHPKIHIPSSQTCVAVQALMCPGMVLVWMDTALALCRTQGGHWSCHGGFVSGSITMLLLPKRVQRRAGCSIRVVELQLCQVWVLGSSTEESKCQTLPGSWRMDAEV